MTNEPAIGSQRPVLDGLDRDFLVRTIRTTLVLGFVLTTWATQMLESSLLGGFAAGVLIGVGSLATTMWAVDRTNARNKSRHSKSGQSMMAALVMLSKLLAIYMALGVLITRWAFSPQAFCAGAGLVMVVIVLKVIGRMTVPAHVAGGK